LIRERIKIAIKTQAIDFKDAMLTIMYTQEALIKLLVRKGIVTEKELLEEVRKVKSKKSTPLT
jgi:hypothetical protein